jgi:NAD(P)-dependent dehydrogenase (short-subunit alcohol dehydrogenase family)
MRVLITGGSGFIGSALVRRLVLEEGWDVVNLDALTYAAAPASLADLEERDNYAFIRMPISATAPPSMPRSSAMNPTLSCTWPPKAMWIARSPPPAPSSTPM